MENAFETGRLFYGVDEARSELIAGFADQIHRDILKNNITPDPNDDEMMLPSQIKDVNEKLKSITIDEEPLSEEEQMKVWEDISDFGFDNE